jgi:VIT1/CCC1 family predicted Fe2+/Mn2+ transporter
MAAGESISVSSQADTERADLDRERKELAADPEHEHAEMTAMYVARGLDHNLASAVTTQLMAHDALGAHSREELGLTDAMASRPVQAALASAGTFSVGALLPLLIVVAVPRATIIWAVSVSSLIFLALLGSLAAHTGGASVMTGAARVTFWGALAMAVTAGVGGLLG